MNITITCSLCTLKIKELENVGCDSDVINRSIILGSQVQKAFGVRAGAVFFLKIRIINDLVLLCRRQVTVAALQLTSLHI